MGVLAAFRPGIGSAELTAAAALVGPADYSGVKSPWAAPANLSQVVWSDIFGKDILRPLTRSEAMRLPEVARARGIICSTIARVSMRRYKWDTDEPIPGRCWLDSTAGPMSPFHRDTMTADDLYFYGWSLWRRTRNTAPDERGKTWPLHADRVPMGEWELEQGTGRVLIYKPDALGRPALQPARADEVILIPGPHEGLLVDGVDSVRHAVDLHRAASTAAKNPSAYLALSQLPGSIPLKQYSDDPTEVTARTVVDAWAAARRGENGGVAFLGQLKAEELGTFDQHLVVEGRNAAAVDIARHSQIPADLIDATMTNSSLQYTTSRDNDRRAIDYGIGFYMGAISARLSLDDVSPHGTEIRFDLEKWLQGEAPVPGQPATTPGAPAPAATTGETPQ